MIDLINYPKDLESYLSQMRNELDEFQNLIREMIPSLSKEEYWDWFFDNKELVKTTSILSFSVEMSNEEDTKTAREETFKKHIETMNVFFNIAFGVNFRI